MQRLSRPPPIQKLGYVKNLFINSTEKYFNHTTHPLPVSNLTATLNTHNLRRDLITNTHNPQHLKPPPRTSATHTPPTTRCAQTSSPHTNRPVQYSIDRALINTYITRRMATTHTSYCLILYTAENHTLQLNI